MEAKELVTASFKCTTKCAKAQLQDTEEKKAAAAQVAEEGGKPSKLVEEIETCSVITNFDESATASNSSTQSQSSHDTHTLDFQEDRVYYDQCKNTVDNFIDAVCSKKPMHYLKELIA